MTRVAIFTDNDFGKVNGVTTTLNAVLRHTPGDVRPCVFTLSDLGVRDPDYVALMAVGAGIPYYRDMRLYAPRVAALVRETRAFRATLIHVTTPGPVGLAARWIARRLGLPMVGSFHTHLAEYASALSGSQALGRAMNAYMRWLYAPCEPVLVPSQATAAMLETAGWRRDRLALWSRGVDAAVFTPAKRNDGLRERWRVSERRPAILYAGRLSREKGLDLLPQIGSWLSRWRVPFRLIVVGDGPYRRQLQEACPDAVFTGTLGREGVAEAMASADLFLFPSATDSLGNVVLEAQAAGLPVVVSDQGGPRENMAPWVTGHVSMAGDPLDFAWRVASILQDREMRTTMAVRARAYGEQRSWSTALAPLYETWRARGRAAHAPAAGRLSFAERLP